MGLDYLVSEDGVAHRIRPDSKTWLDAISPKGSTSHIGDHRGLCWILGDRVQCKARNKGITTPMYPASLSFPSRPVELSMSGWAICARLEEGTVHCWGTGYGLGLDEPTAYPDGVTIPAADLLENLARR